MKSDSIDKMHQTNKSDTHLPATNWRPAIAEGISIWIAILGMFVFLPPSQPLSIAIALATILGGPLLPLALLADFRQAWTMSNCPPTPDEYLWNIAADIRSSFLGRTVLGTHRSVLFDCSRNPALSCPCVE